LVRGLGTLKKELRTRKRLLLQFQDNVSGSQSRDIGVSLGSRKSEREFSIKESGGSRWVLLCPLRSQPPWSQQFKKKNKGNNALGSPKRLGERDREPN